jgi:hypothetical protein
MKRRVDYIKANETIQSELKANATYWLDRLTRFQAVPGRGTVGATRRGGLRLGRSMPTGWGSGRVITRCVKAVLYDRSRAITGTSRAVIDDSFSFALAFSTDLVPSEAHHVSDPRPALRSSVPFALEG